MKKLFKTNLITDSLLNLIFWRFTDKTYQTHCWFIERNSFECINFQLSDESSVGIFIKPYF